MNEKSMSPEELAAAVANTPSAAATFMVQCQRLSVRHEVAIQEMQLFRQKCTAVPTLDAIHEFLNVMENTLNGSRDPYMERAKAELREANRIFRQQQARRA